MAIKRFGYARVSTKDQSLARQIEILKVERIEGRDIFVGKESGRSPEQKVYRSLVDTILREGDLLMVTELKRFRRNYREIYQERHHITKEIGADIRITSVPVLNTTQSGELVGQLTTSVMLAVFAYMADEDWTKHHGPQRQGIEVTKAEGGHLDRPKVQFPENWDEWYPKWTTGEVTALETMRQMGIEEDSFYRLVKRYEENSSNLEDGGTRWINKGIRAMKQGTLFYDKESDRYDFCYDRDGKTVNYGGIHCGEVFELCLNGVWVPARVEVYED